MIHNIGFSDYGWDDLRVPLTAGKLGINSPPGFVQLADNGAGSTGIFVYHFSPSSEEQIYFEVQMPHDWQTGTTIYPHVHWCGISTQASVKVVWGLEYNITPIHTVMGATTILTGDTPISGDTGVTTKKHQVTLLGSGIDMSAYTELSDIIFGRLFRKAGDAQDTYANDAAAFSFDMHYRRNRLGSPSFASSQGG